MLKYAKIGKKLSKYFFLIQNLPFPVWVERIYFFVCFMKANLSKHPFDVVFFLFSVLYSTYTIPIQFRVFRLINHISHMWFCTSRCARHYSMHVDSFKFSVDYEPSLSMISNHISWLLATSLYCVYYLSTSFCLHIPFKWMRSSANHPIRRLLMEIYL